jgi:outer membrane protein assembly factor BamD
LAAANRSQEVVRYYPDAPAVEEALAVMAYSYGQLGLTDLQADSDRVLRKNYPNSRFLTEGIQRSKPWYQLY